MRVCNHEKLMCLRSYHGYPLNNCIEALAMSALYSQEMPSSIFFRLFTVVANYRHCFSKVRRNRLKSYAHCHGVPGREHALVCLGSLFAHRAARIVCSKITKTVPVDGVATWHLMAGGTARKKVLLTHRAVGHILSYLAVMLAE